MPGRRDESTVYHHCCASTSDNHASISDNVRVGIFVNPRRHPATAMAGRVATKEHNGRATVTSRQRFYYWHSNGVIWLYKTGFIDYTVAAPTVSNATEFGANHILGQDWELSLSSFLGSIASLFSSSHPGEAADLADPSRVKKAKAMTDKPAYLTRDGRANLEVELEELTTSGRKQVAERIGAAKELGDISESGEYEDAKNSQAHLEARIREIKSILSRAQLIDEDPVHGNEVRVGARVTVRIDGEDDDETWTIVGSTEANPAKGKISNESPIGSALLGKRLRQKVNVQTPSGALKLTIMKIS